jgi:hypothetical protein
MIFTNSGKITRLRQETVWYQSVPEGKEQVSYALCRPQCNVLAMQIQDDAFLAIAWEQVRVKIGVACHIH